MRILEKSNLGKKLANTRNANFWENCQKLLGERYQNSVFSVLDVVVHYKRAKFGKDRFGNGGATTFFDFAYKDRPKKSISGVGRITSLHFV